MSLVDLGAGALQRAAASTEVMDVAARRLTDYQGIAESAGRVLNASERSQHFSLLLGDSKKMRRYVVEKDGVPARLNGALVREETENAQVVANSFDDMMAKVETLYGRRPSWDWHHRLRDPRWISNDLHAFADKVAETASTASLGSKLRPHATFADDFRAASPNVFYARQYAEAVQGAIRFDVDRGGVFAEHLPLHASRAAADDIALARATGTADDEALAAYRTARDTELIPFDAFKGMLRHEVGLMPLLLKSQHDEIERLDDLARSFDPLADLRSAHELLAGRAAATDALTDRAAVSRSLDFVDGADARAASHSDKVAEMEHSFDIVSDATASLEAAIEGARRALDTGTDRAAAASDVRRAAEDLHYAAWKHRKHFG